MPETETQEAPTAQEAPKWKPISPRAAIKTGFPADGYWVLAGLPKGGKTTLGASIPGGVILELERGGADRVSGWVQEIPDHRTFRAALSWAMDRDNQEVKAIVIDTLDVVLNNIADEVAESFDLASMSERKAGVNGFDTWRELDRRVGRMVDTFKTCGKLVILLAHFKEPKLDNEGKLVITQSITSPSARVSSYLCSHADVIGVVSKRRTGETSQYSVKFHGEGVIAAYGSRIPELEDKTVILPKKNQWQAIVDACSVPKIEPAAAKAEPIKTTARAHAAAGRK